LNDGNAIPARNCGKHWENIGAQADAPGKAARVEQAVGFGDSHD